MISDVLSDAIHEIREYQKELPGCYNSVRAEIDAVVAVMDRLRAKLDMPLQSMTEEMDRLRALQSKSDLMRDTAKKLGIPIVEFSPATDDVWNDDQVQFSRLIDEINAMGLTRKQYRTLCESMDLTQAELDDLFDRAGAAFFANKERILKGE